MSLSMAAQRVGYELVEYAIRKRSSKQNRISCSPSSRGSRRRLTFRPLAWCIRRAAYLWKAEAIRGHMYSESLLTYDGYLTIADSLCHFSRPSVLEPVDRHTLGATTTPAAPRADV